MFQYNYISCYGSCGDSQSVIICHDRKYKSSDLLPELLSSYHLLPELLSNYDLLPELLSSYHYCRAAALVFC